MELHSKEFFIIGIVVVILARVLEIHNFTYLIGLILLPYGLFGNPFEKTKSD